MWSVHPNIFSMTFYAKEPNFNPSVWLILYSKPDLKCMKWIKSKLCCDCYTKINLFFTVLNYGPKRLVSPAVLRMPETCMWSMYAKIIFWRQTSQRLKGNEWTEGQCHVAQTRLHKNRHHSFLIPHSQIWIPYPHFYLPRRTFMSSHPTEPIASHLCTHPKQYIPKKHKRFGIKIYKLCDETGYTYNMTVYLGRYRQLTVQHLTATHASVRIDRENTMWPQIVHGQLLFLPGLIRWLGDRKSVV
jgi:hypothetical protein